MTVKIVLGIALVFTATVAGYKLADKKRYKRYIYEQLVAFCNKIKFDVAYNGATVDKYVDELPDAVKKTFSLSSESFLSGSKADIRDKRFTFEEKTEIEEFFAELGKYDTESFLKMMEFYTEKFVRKFDFADSDYKKCKSFYIKIGALFGTLLFVIIV